MDEALGLDAYLPVSYKTQTEKEYMAFLWDAFESNYANGKFEFASLAFHLLYMSFVSFSIWQIRLARGQDFRNALVGFQSDSETSLLEAETPFRFYEKLKESQIFRFLKLIGCSNEHVGEFAKFVKRRNKIAHPSGTVFFNDQVSIDKEIFEMMREVDNIQRHMTPVVLEVYNRFLIESSDVDAREYALPEQEIEGSLIHGCYFSRKDFEPCFAVDLLPLASHPNYSEITVLHDAVRASYGEADALAVPKSAKTPAHAE